MKSKPMQRTGCDRRAADASQSFGGGLHVEAGKLSRLGWIWVERDDRGVLHAVHLPGLFAEGPAVPPGAGPMREDLREALACYERGEGQLLSGLRLAPAATEFAKIVREAMRNIPLGEVRTYGQLAEEVGRPGAARAIGRACGANPLPLVVPCHRVVAAKGLGGFGLGLEAKRVLLAMEGIDVAIRAGFR